MISTRPRRRHGRRDVQLGGMIAVFAALVVGFTGCNGTPSQTASSATPEPSSAENRLDRSEPKPPRRGPRPPIPVPSGFVKVEPPPKPDLRIGNDRDRFLWTGPWDLDIVGLTLVNNRDWLTVRVDFARMKLQTKPASGASFEVRLATVDGSPPRLLWGTLGEREPGQVLGAFDIYFPRCDFVPQPDRANRTLIIRVRRNCFPPEPMRAHGWFYSDRKDGWYAIDLTAWTDYASLGQTVTVGDPGR